MPVSQGYSRDVDGLKLETFITFLHEQRTYLEPPNQQQLKEERKIPLTWWTYNNSTHEWKFSVPGKGLWIIVLEDKLFIPDFDIITIAMIHSTYNWCTQLYKFALQYALCLIHLLYCIRANGNDSMFYSEGNRRKAELFESPFNDSQNCFALS